MPHGLLLQQRLAGLRRCFLPGLTALGGMPVPPPLSSLDRPFKLREPPFPPLCNESNTFSRASIPRNHPHSGSGCFQRDHPSDAGGRVWGLIWKERCPLHSYPVGCIPQMWTNVPAGKVPASRMPTASTSLAATAASAPEGTRCCQAGLVWVSGGPQQAQGREVRVWNMRQSQALPTVTWVEHSSVCAFLFGWSMGRRGRREHLFIGE